MLILRETDVAADALRLDSAWSDPRSFAFVPARGAPPQAWIDAALASLPEEYRQNHFALLTSGSTGQPKLVVGSRARAERLAEALHAAQDNEPAEAAVVALPLSYCYAFVNQWLWARRLGRRLVPPRGCAAPDELARTLKGEAAAMLCLVGAQVPLALQHFPGARFEGVRRLHFAGGRFPQERLDELAAMFPNARIYNNYGCAEAMPRLTLRRAEEAADARVIGRPLPGVELRGGPGDELLFRSPYGAVAFVDEAGCHGIGPGDWTATGDLGRSRADGQWELLGRASEVFKRYGEKVSLHQLLATVAEAWKGEAAFFREADPAGEDGVVLVLAPSPTAEDVRTVLRGFRARPRAHWPLRIEAARALPLLANGKIVVRGLAAETGREIMWRQKLG